MNLLINLPLIVNSFNLEQSKPLYFITGLLLLFTSMGLIYNLYLDSKGSGLFFSFISISLFFLINIFILGINKSHLSYFLLGLALILFELLIPGFTIVGITGFLISIYSIIQTYPNNYLGGLVVFIVFVLSFIIIRVLKRKGHRINLFEKIGLKTEINSKDTLEKSYEEYLGKEGTALTILRPSGKARIGSEVLDVMSEGGFIEKESKIKVVKVQGNKIIVRRYLNGDIL